MTDSLEEIRNERLKKIDILRSKGIDPYPAETNRTHSIKEFTEQFGELIKADEQYTVAGRIMSIREHGASAFVDLYDDGIKLQGYIKEDECGKELFDLFQEVIDRGDFIEVTGTAFVTKKGQQSLLVKKWNILSKSIIPIPDNYYGLKDEDDRFRKRYLGMLLEEDVADLVRKRSVFWNAFRKFLTDRGHIEVETPVLHTMTGGAEARPFITHHNALDIDVFLRISLELFHKKMMVAGFPKVFEIGRVFRNEGMSHEHAQDFTFIEFYEAYLDGRHGVQMLIDMYRYVAETTFGTLEFQIGDHKVNLGADWKNVDYNELMIERFGFDPRDVTLDEVKKYLAKEKIPIENGLDIGRGVDLLWKLVRKGISGPAVLTGMPVYLEPLAKKNKKDDRVVDRFQILIGGSEVGKAFNELNDPIDQRERFEKQQALRDAGDDEAQMADMDYVEAMEYGMPPMFGFGVSERLFSFLANVSIREAQLFPLMKPKND